MVVILHPVNRYGHRKAMRKRKRRKEEEKGEKEKKKKNVFVGCLTSQQHASVSQGRI